LGIDLVRHRDNIFGLYQRFHSNADGKGLGLFIVKSQVTALGGSIDVTSEIDKGTSFIITFKEELKAQEIFI
jgi:signal transduction histidine kinase